MPTIIKRLFLLLLCCNAISLTAKDSVNWNIVSAGGGSYSVVQLTEGVKSGENGYDSRPIVKYSGTFSMNYRRYISPRVSLAMSVGFENESGQMNVNNNYYTNATHKTGTFKRQVYTVAPEVYLNYKQDYPLVHGYCYLGLGYTYMVERDNYDVVTNQYTGAITPAVQASHKNLYFTGQICPMGVSIGNKLRGFIELGFGYKGIINGGALLSF